MVPCPLCQASPFPFPSSKRSPILWPLQTGSWPQFVRALCLRQSDQVVLFLPGFCGGVESTAGGQIEVEGAVDSSRFLWRRRILVVARFKVKGAVDQFIVSVPMRNQYACETMHKHRTSTDWRHITYSRHTTGLTALNACLIFPDQLEAWGGSSI